MSDVPQPEPGGANRQAPDKPRGFFRRALRTVRGVPADRDELIDELRTAHEHELVDAESLAMIEAVLQVTDLQVRDVMIPRSQMVIVERDCSVRELLKTVVDSGHSRFPVAAVAAIMPSEKR